VLAAGKWLANEPMCYRRPAVGKMRSLMSNISTSVRDEESGRYDRMWLPGIELSVLRQEGQVRRCVGRHVV
jgi:hypothetical protein